MLERGATLVLATHNAGKLRELRELLAPFVVDLRAASDLGLHEPEETGLTFRENAALKAREAAVRFPAIADDSGLVVPALGGAPGIHSARWAGAERDFTQAMQRVHDELGARGRAAMMITVLALAWPDGRVETFEGIVDGELVWPPRGALGFGYEPMFRPLGATRTYGEMPRDEKHRDDPRARAFAALRAACFGSETSC
jgi:XTP/dITP diphosphohydrolase